MISSSELSTKPVPEEKNSTKSQYECLRCHRKFRSFWGLKYHMQSVNCLSQPYADGTKSAEREITEGCVEEAITAYIARRPEERSAKLKRKLGGERGCRVMPAPLANSDMLQKSLQKKLKSLPPIKPRPVPVSTVVWPVECINGMTSTPTTLQGSFEEALPSALQSEVYQENAPIVSVNCMDNLHSQTLNTGVEDNTHTVSRKKQSNINSDSNFNIAKSHQMAARRLNEVRAFLSTSAISKSDLLKVLQPCLASAPSIKGDVLESAWVVTSNAASQLTSIGSESGSVTDSQRGSTTVDGLTQLYVSKDLSISGKQETNTESGEVRPDSMYLSMPSLLSRSICLQLQPLSPGVVMANVE